MSETSQTARAIPSDWLSWFLAAAIAGNLFSIVTVNYWIYYARSAFIARNPAYVAEQPPTISRAISDPFVGVPFAFWITVSAVLLVLGVLALTLVYVRLARVVPFETEAQRRTLVGAVFAVLIAQGFASVGMYMLSNFRFPDDNGWHMIGSYIFFVAEALVIVGGIVACSALLRSRVSTDMLETLGFARRPVILFRKWAGVLSVGLTVFYILLFKAKDIDFGEANTAIYATYVLVEPMVISSFLLFLALFQVDLWAMIRSRRID